MKNRLEFNFKDLIKDQTFEFKYYYLFGTLFLFFTHKIQSELPFLAKELADLVGDSKNSINVSKFFWFALGIIIFRTSSRILFFFPARVLQKYLREELLRKIQESNPIRYKSLSSGQLFQYLTGDIDQIRALIGFVGLQGGNFVIGLLVLVPRMIAFSSQLLWALTPMLVSFFIFTFIVSKNREFFKKTQEAQGEVQNLIIESYLGKKTIKNFQAEKPFIDLFENISLKELYYFYRSSLGISVTLPLISLGIGLSMLWGAYIIKMQNLGAGTLILFSGFIFLFMEPLGYLSWIGVVVSRSHASWKRLYELNEKLITVVEEEKTIQFSNEKLDLNEFKFNFWEKELDLKIKLNQWNILVSKTGHGKTVLLEKMAQILKIKKATLSMVFQDPYIYNDSILNNIFLGREVTEPLRDDAKKLLKLMGLDYLDSNLDQLLNLEVGENGKRLSGGQQKRLALVRSILSEAEFILWDDPFSSVDLILEKEIFNNLKNLKILENKTIILTSHRLTTVRNSDFVFFIDKEHGLYEEGRTDELLLGNSKLYEYFQQQMV
jgi:ATP-binding cassette subfamily B protein